VSRGNRPREILLGLLAGMAFPMAVAALAGMALFFP
jgi:hypothetical protein